MFGTAGGTTGFGLFFALLLETDPFEIAFAFFFALFAGQGDFLGFFAGFGLFGLPGCLFLCAQTLLFCLTLYGRVKGKK